MLLVNPTGRYVELDENWEHWLQQPGFRKATEQEEREYRERRILEHAKMSGDLSYKESLYLVSVSERGGADGYGMSSKHLIEALEWAGVPVSEYYTEQDIGLLYHSPHSITRLDTKYKIIYTMFESDKIPEDWYDYLHAADLVIVPSKWCQKTFKKSGVDSIVVPLGYNDKVFKYVKRPKRDTFTFLHYDAFNARKGHFEVLEAFDQEFDKVKEKHIKLILKTSREIAPIPIVPSEYPNIKVVYDKVPEQELFKLCEQADAFLFPSRGEGFGITPLEAMATGLPAIVPNAHGISEYFNKNYMLGVRATEKCTAIYRRLTNVGYMRKCNVDDIRKQMRWCIEHPDEARALGTKASKYVQKWTYSKTAEQLKKIFDDIKKKPLPERKVGDILPLQEV
jgi:glycosyltransferase involved in cell wall biosynthesis